MGLEPYLFASAVTGILAQRLVRTICATCREEMPTPSGMRALFRGARGPAATVDLAGLRAAGPLKLAPAADAPPHWSEAAELCWLGSRGECRQQVAWFGTLAFHRGLHSATVVDAPGGARTIVGST